MFDHSHLLAWSTRDVLEDMSLGFKAKKPSIPPHSVFIGGEGLTHGGLYRLNHRRLDEGA